MEKTRTRSPKTPNPVGFPAGMTKKAVYRTLRRNGYSKDRLEELNVLAIAADDVESPQVRYRSAFFDADGEMLETSQWADTPTRAIATLPKMGARVIEVLEQEGDLPWKHNKCVTYKDSDGIPVFELLVSTWLLWPKKWVRMGRLTKSNRVGNLDHFLLGE